MIAPPKTPSPTELEALIKEARARQLRRRLLGAAGVAVAAALGLVAYALAGGFGTQGSAAASPPAQPPLCRSSQLATSFTPGAATGTDLGGMTFRNTGSGACSLPSGRPAVQVRFRGERLPTRERSWPAGSSFGRPAHVLAPGATAFVEIGWGDACMNLTSSAPVSPKATFLLRFRDGMRLIVPETPPDRTVVVPGCNGAVLHPTPRLFVTPMLRSPA